MNRREDSASTRAARSNPAARTNAESPRHPSQSGKARQKDGDESPQGNQKPSCRVHSGDPQSHDLACSAVSVARKRMCIACRKHLPPENLLRLTVDFATGQVRLNEASPSSSHISGRSAYICCLLNCLEAAMKGTRLKQALQGRKLKGAPEKRQVAWPLESQLIHTLRCKCTEKLESCQNTLRKEGC